MIFLLRCFFIGALIYFPVFTSLSAPVAPPVIKGSPIVDNPKVTNPFNSVGEGKLQGSNGIANPNYNTNANSTLTSAGFVDAASFQSIIGTNVSTGVLGSIGSAAGLTSAQLSAAKVGNLSAFKDPASAANLKQSMLAVGYSVTLIKLRYNVSYVEKIASLSGVGSPIVVNSPTVMGRLAPDPLNAGTKPAQISSYFTGTSTTDITTFLSTILKPQRLYPLTVAPGNGLKVEWPCGIDVLTGADTCCGLSASNAIFHIQKGIGIGDDLDVPGSGDAAVLDQTGVPIVLSSDTDALARLVLCSSTSAMDVVVSGSSKITAQGIPVK